MKPIEQLSDHEKTLAIIGLMPDWSVWGHGDDGDHIIVTMNDRATACFQSPDYLYAEKWMFLAWRVLNWAHKWLTSDRAEDKMLEWYYNIDDMLQWHLAPDAAQRKWLDKILSLAIEAGLCEDTAVSQETGE